MISDVILAELRQHNDISAKQISVMTGLRAGSMYPVLLGLEQSGQIESRWCDEDAAYPRRRVYRIKGEQT